MIDLKQPKKSKKELKEGMEAPVPDQDAYPWGTRLNFETEQIEKMPALQKADAGEKVQIKAIGTIISVNVRDYVDGIKKRKSVEIQIEKIEIADSRSEKAGFDSFMDKKRK